MPSRHLTEILKERRAFCVPLALTVSLILLSFVPRVQANLTLVWSFWGAAAFLLAWQVLLIRRVTPGRGVPSLRVELRAQHYLQAMAQFSVFAYWGWYWQPVYDAATLLIAQLCFAYAFDLLLAWSRREQFTLGFGPFPIIFSTNLFLWFKDDWFYWQFVMVAAGFLGKAFIRWNRSGRRVHIFNPSAFSLALFSLALLVTGSTSLTWGVEIATTLYHPPNIYLFIFLIGLVGQFRFKVTLMTLAAVATVYAFSLAYTASTGVYYFIDSAIPIAVFLGMHLLFTDPSTSPRSGAGRVMFGFLYGTCVVALYGVLTVLGTPTFYDKLLGVPLMNLLVRRIERATGGLRMPVAETGWRTIVAPDRFNVAHMAVWGVLFAVMTATGAVGDRHPGHSIPFWQQACDEGRRSACVTLQQIEAAYCRAGSGWACNEVGMAFHEGGPAGLPTSSGAWFSRACELGFGLACTNAALAASPTFGIAVRRAPPPLAEWPLLLQDGKGSLPQMSQLALATRACDHQWPTGCREVALMHLRGTGIDVDYARAAEGFQRGCDLRDPPSCSNLGLMYRRGEGVPADDRRALALLQRACEMGMADACGWLREETLGRGRGDRAQ